MDGENATPVGRTGWLYRTTTILQDRLPPARIVEFVALATMVAMAGISYFVVVSKGQSGALLTPPLVAALLVANLVPAMALMVLLGRRIARRRTPHAQTGRHSLHVRLVALFSLVAAVPTLLVAIFASLLFQYGVDFWFSDRSRGMLENAASLAQGYYDENVNAVRDNTPQMAMDLAQWSERSPIGSSDFTDYYLYQMVARNLTRSAIIQIGNDGIARALSLIDPENREADNLIPPEVANRLLAGEEVIVVADSNRIAAATLFDRERRIFLYASRDANSLGLNQIETAQAVLTDYNALFARSRQLQLQFNLSIYIVSLILVGFAVWTALVVADRLVRPITDLVTAARRVASGDLEARVEHSAQADEIGALSTAFNRMTEQLGVQTRALLDANTQIESRRALIEAVLSGVSAGVLSIGRDGRVQLLNVGAQVLLDTDQERAVGQTLASLRPELADVVASGDKRAIVNIGSGADERTLAVRVSSEHQGHVVTFEDITQQLTDQRRAAWADVARRIAHEIKNPLTPIQLAAERLQRRYGRTIEDDGTFAKLTGTIVRQVGDLRRMVDEFSNFARMPKPVFHAENLVDIVRQAVFLHEVAHPEIDFSLASADDLQPVVCDRRQLTQALTNVVKNAVEAIQRNPKSSDKTIEVSLVERGSTLVIGVADSGVGLPQQRDTLVEPYMTTREGGTGLGLAIVKKIVEDHKGRIAFSDRDGGGAMVAIIFDRDQLAALGSETSDAGTEDDEKQQGN